MTSNLSRTPDPSSLSSVAVHVETAVPGIDLAPARPAGAELLRLPQRFDAAHVEKHGPHWSSLANSGRNLIADTRHVTFIDSTGVGAMIRLARMTRAQGAEFVVAAPSGAVQRVLELMKLTSAFTIVSEISLSVAA